LTQTERSSVKDGEQPGKTGLNSHETNNVESAPPTTPVELVLVSGSADKSGSESVTAPMEVSSSRRDDPSQSDPLNAETQSTSLTESTVPLEPTASSLPAELNYDPPSHRPHSQPPPTLVETVPIEETPILDTVAEIMERDRENSTMGLSPPPYEPRAEDSHSQAESVPGESPDIPVIPSMDRMEAERKFKEAANKLDELVRRTRPDREVDDFPTPSEFTDAAIYTHAKSIKAIMEEFLKQKVVSEATRSKSSKFIDKWFQATFTIVKSTLQLLSVFLYVLSEADNSLFQLLIWSLQMGLCVSLRYYCHATDLTLI